MMTKGTEGETHTDSNGVQTTEYWKMVPGENWAISSQGRMVLTVKSGRFLRGHEIKFRPTNVAKRNDRRAYLGTVLKCADGRKRMATLHILVAQAFLGPRPAKTVINHIDGNKLNCAASNLEYCSHRENNLHAVRMGLTKKRRFNAGQVREMRRLFAENMPCMEIAKMFNCKYGVASHAIHRRHYKDIV